MLSIATLFDDEQRLLNRVWIILLGLEALLVLFGTVSAVVRGVVAIRRRRPGGLRRGGRYHGRPRRVTIELPATAFAYDVRPGADMHKGLGLEMDGASDLDLDHDMDAINAMDGVYFTDGTLHTLTRGQTPTRIFSSPSSKV